MTVDELINSPNKRAMGKYQIIPNTLKMLKTELELTGNEKFDRNLQDSLFKHLAYKRGYNEYKSGDITAEEFAYNLSKEWAALPKNSSNESYYEGRLGNTALIGWDNTLELIKNLF